MTSNEVIGFILPQTDDLIQVSFLAIIVLTMTATMFSAWLNANESSWEKKWNRGTPNDASDDLGIEHGSVTDLWHAVATASEKVSEIMPGMLLVIGLLGTFLGLGLALNKASSILGQTDLMSAGAAADSMGHLMGLLQGLGTKFKTSTWGITGFVLLKIWSEAMRYDEKRLAWVIGKVKTELEKRKLEEKTSDMQKRNELHAQIASTADHVVAGLAEQVGKMLEQDKAMHKQVLHNLEGQFKGLTEMRAEISISSEKLVTEQSKNIGMLLTQEIDMHKRLIQRLDSQREGLTELKTEISISTNVIAAEQTKQINKLLTQEIDMHKQLLQRLDGQREGLTELKVEMCATKDSMQHFTQGTQSVVEQMANAAQQMAGGAGDIGEAAERMAQGADKVGIAGKELVGAIDEFKTQFTAVLDDVRKDLGKSIHDMSTQAATTLEKGSNQLSNATREISTALGVLSEDVKTTMNEVKDSIGEALKIQQKAANEFTLSTGNLNENIAATTNIVGELANPIKEGLRSVSDTGQHMRSVGRSLDKSLQIMQDVVTKLALLPSALQPVSELSNHHQQMVSVLKPLSDLSGHQQQIIQEMQGLRIDLKAITATTEFEANQPLTAN